ncbi:MAG: DNA-directed RNA polymerase subunit omega [Clostridia bacterium]|jgi:DNA-directed RNA polymerase omega subunit|nr:DNA-directed RNA polymerase subunit omega [Clostridia bacterium]
MINEPSVDVMIRKLGTEEEPISRYALCTVAAKRARQIIETEKNAGVTDSMGKDKELLAACKDIAEGKVVIAKD